MRKALLIGGFFVVSYYVYFTLVGWLVVSDYYFGQSKIAKCWEIGFIVWVPFIVLALVLASFLVKYKIKGRNACFVLALYMASFLIIVEPFQAISTCVP